MKNLTKEDLKEIEDLDIRTDKLINNCLLESNELHRVELVEVLTQLQNVMLNMKERFEDEN